MGVKPKPPTVAHFNVGKLNVLAANAPNAFAHAPAVKQAVAHLAVNIIPAANVVDLLTNKISRGLVDGPVAAGYHFGLFPHDRINTLAQRAGHLVVSQQLIVDAQVSAAGA